MTLLRLALRLLYRQWRSGELLVLGLALLIGVAAMTAVGMFTDRIQRVLTQEAGELLAADLSLSSNRALKPEWQTKAEQLGLKSALFVELRTVVLAADQVQLVEAKGVDSHYPLRGAMRIRDSAGGAAHVMQQGPPAGSVWPDAMLAGRLGLKVGDPLQLGTLTLHVAAILSYEPDRAGSIFTIAPRLMFNLQDLPQTGLIGVGSLRHEHLLLAGKNDAVESMEQWLQPIIGPSETLRNSREGRPELVSALQRAEHFLGLAALMAVLLAGVAIAIAAHRYARRHFDAAAVMRCIGARGNTVLQLFALSLLLIGLVASLSGVALGFAAQEVLAQLLRGLFNQPLPLPGWSPVLFGLVVGMLMLLGFALPPLAALSRVPPLRVLRRELEPDAAGMLVRMAAVITALLLCGWQAGELKLALMVIAGVTVTVLLLALFGWQMIRALQRLRRRGGVAWHYGVANLSRRMGATVVQLVALGLAVMVMLLLTLVRTDLLANWEQQLPPDASNTFLINVQQSQLEPLQTFLHEAGVNDVVFSPMVKGRLLAVNDRQVAAEDYQEDRAQRLVKREFNLSWATQMGTDNRIVTGDWWPADEPIGMQWSVEEGLAKTLGIALGDALTFDIAGTQLVGQVSSLRSVQWDSFRVNFFVIAPPGHLPETQASYITSFYLPPSLHQTGSTLLRQFPTITLIDVDEVMQRVRAIISRVALAVEFVFGFTLLAAITVLLAAVQSSLDERMREVAVMRTLGAGNALLHRAVLAEFILLGLLAGLLAALTASAVAWGLSSWVFEMPWHFNPWILLAGLLVGGLIIPLFGMLATRRVLHTPPLLLLRQ